MNISSLGAENVRLMHERMARAADTFFRRGVSQFVTDMSGEIACAPNADEVALFAVSRIGMRDFTQIERATSAVRLSAQVSWMTKGYNASIECLEFFAIPFMAYKDAQPDIHELARCVNEGKLFPDTSRVLLTPNWCSMDEVMLMASSPSGVKGAFQSVCANSSFSTYPVILSSSVSDGEYPRAILGAVANVVAAPGVFPPSVLSRLYDGVGGYLSAKASSLSHWREYAAGEMGVRRVGLPMRVSDVRLFRDVAVASGEQEWGKRIIVN